MAEDYLDRVYKDLWTQYGKVGYKEQAGEELMQLLYGIIGRMEIMERRLAEHRELPMQHRADEISPSPAVPDA